jgi:hypothetical protein
MFYGSPFLLPGFVGQKTGKGFYLKDKRMKGKI